MKEDLIKVVKLLKEENKTISTMESCTGGYLASSITNVDGASDVLLFSAVTYSTKYKIKMGVDEKIIDKYTVYSKETAMNMAYNISKFTDSNYGIGITGKLNKTNELDTKGYTVNFAIYNKDNNTYYSEFIKLENTLRETNKKIIVNIIIKKIIEILE